MRDTDLPPDLDAWLGRQPDADDLRQTWSLAALAEPAHQSDTDAAWARLDAALDAPTARRAADRPAARSATRPRRARWIAAASAALAAVALVIGLRNVTVYADDLTDLVLPDGSEVALAPGTEIEYRRGLWGDTRAVRLDGQAAFHVRADGRPFRVETFNATVEVLGTTFDVRAWGQAAAPETAVTLVEGSVRLADARGRAVVLAPGQSSRVGRGAPIAPAAIDADAVTAWRDGRFTIVDAPLGAVVEAVEAQFDVTVRLGERVDPGRRLTLLLSRADSAQAVLEDVAAYLDLRLQSGAEGYDLLAR